MNWFWWLLVCTFVVEAMCRIVVIGEPRKPSTKGDAVSVLVINALLIWGVVHYASKP